MRGSKDAAADASRVVSRTEDISLLHVLVVSEGWGRTSKTSAIDRTSEAKTGTEATITDQAGGGPRPKPKERMWSAALCELAGDQDLLDLVGAVIDLEDAGVPIVFLHAEVGDEAVAAVNLDGL